MLYGPNGWMKERGGGGGSAGKMYFFQIAPTLHMSVLIYSNRRHYHPESFIENNFSQPSCSWERQTLNSSALPKCPVLHAILVIFTNARAHTYGPFQVCKNVLIHSSNDSVKFEGIIPTPGALLGQLKGWWTLAHKLLALANCYQITVCECETAFISYVTFEAW